MKKSICIVTATRAEYGLLKSVIKKFIDTQQFEIRVVVTGTHLSTEYGYTVKEIENDNIPIDARLEIIPTGSQEISGNLMETVIMSNATRQFGDYFEMSRPNLLVLLGDRFELLAIASAALAFCIPIAHLYGGDVSEGAIDDCVRHALTKLSNLHFVATPLHKKRVIQMGENPDSVFRVGALSVEASLMSALLSKEELVNFLEWDWGESEFAVVTYHPATIENGQGVKQIEMLLGALDMAYDKYRLKYIITGANMDSEGMEINRRLRDYAEKNKNKACMVMSLGQKRYLTALKLCSMVIGNSSSGLSETPSFHIPTINIGIRQQGRETGDTVINCGNSTEEIFCAIQKGLNKDFRASLANSINPYEMSGTSDNIVRIISDLLEQDKIKRIKHFSLIKEGEFWG